MGIVKIFEEKISENMLFYFLLGAAAVVTAEQGPDGQEPKTIFEFDVKNAQGETVSLSKSDNNKVTLIVNVASNCGYTDQYAELVTLQNNFGDDLQVRICTYQLQQLIR